MAARQVPLNDVDVLLYVDVNVSTSQIKSYRRTISHANYYRTILAVKWHFTLT